MVVSETGSHPFAVRSSTRSVSYILDALSPGAKTCYLEILGVSAEPTLKFVEEYYRWPKLYRNHSRLMSLGSWACIFRDASNVAYSKSAIHIALDQGRVLEQHRGQVKRAKTQFINATLDWLAVATRIYERAREFPDATGAKYIALAIAAPGFHRHLRRLQSGFTVVLPKIGEQVRGRGGRGSRATRPRRRLLRRFLFLHVVAGQLPILPGHAVFLTYSRCSRPFSQGIRRRSAHRRARCRLVGKDDLAAAMGVGECLLHRGGHRLQPSHLVDARSRERHVGARAGPSDVDRRDRRCRNPSQRDGRRGPAQACCRELPERVAACGMLRSTSSDDDHALVRRAGLHIVTEGASRVAFTARASPTSAS